MSTRTHVDTYLLNTQGQATQERREELAAKMIASGNINANSTVAELWASLHLILFNAPVGGGSIPGATDMAKLAADARADLEATLGRPATADEIATIAFQVEADARSKGWAPAKKPTQADQLATIDLETLAREFPLVGDVAKFRDMTASKRAEYALIILERQTVAAMAKAAPTPSNEALETLSPEERLNRLWA